MTDFKAAGIIPYAWDGQQMVVLMRPSVLPPPPEADQPPPNPADLPPPGFKEFGGPRGAEDNESLRCAAQHFLAAVTGGRVKPEPGAVDTMVAYLEANPEGIQQFVHPSNGYHFYFVQMTVRMPVGIPCMWIPGTVLADKYHEAGFVHERLVVPGDTTVTGWIRSKAEALKSGGGGKEWEPPLPPPKQMPEGVPAPPAGAPQAQRQ